MQEEAKESKTTRRLLLSYGLYIVAYFTLILSNKGLANTFSDDNWAIVACVIWQAIVSVLLLVLSSSFGISPPIKAINKRKISKIAFAPLLFSIMLFSSLESLKYVSIPTMNAFRNCTIFITAFGERILFGIPISIETSAVLCLMFLSAIVGGWGELSVSPYGLFWISVNFLSSAGYLLYLRVIMKKTRITNFALAYYNNVICIPLLIPLLIYLRMNDSSVSLFYLPYSTQFSFILLVNGVAAFGMTIGSFWALRSSSATTFSVTRSLSKIPLSVLGLYFFPASLNYFSQTSITLALFSALLFAYSKHKQSKKRTEKPPPIYSPTT